MPSTHSEIDLLRQQAATTHLAVLTNVDGLTHEDSLIQPVPGGNRLNWVMGHLVLIDQRILRRLGQPPVMPLESLARYDRGTPPLTDPAQAVPFPTLVHAWAASAPAIDAGLAALTPAALESPVEFTPTHNPNETVRTLLTFLMFHQAYHAGQTGVLRRLAGKPGAIT
jgi:uncharacterized damage-inducible protein DinB